MAFFEVLSLSILFFGHILYSDSFLYLNFCRKRIGIKEEQLKTKTEREKEKEDENKSAILSIFSDFYAHFNLSLYNLFFFLLSYVRLFVSVVDVLDVQPVARSVAMCVCLEKFLLCLECILICLCVCV